MNIDKLIKGLTGKFGEEMEKSAKDMMTFGEGYILLTQKHDKKKGVGVNMTCVPYLKMREMIDAEIELKKLKSKPKVGYGPDTGFINIE